MTTRPLRKLVFVVIVVLGLLAAVLIVLRARPGLATIIIGPWKDWAQISTYHEANAGLVASPEPARVVFFGDSHILGWDLTANFPGKPYINRGIGGQTTAQMLVRFRPDVIALKPRTVVILGGTNDVLIHLRKLPFEQTVDNYASMADLARINNIKVIFLAVPPVNDSQTERWTARLEQPDRIKKLNEWLKNYCDANGFLYLDDYDMLVDDKGMFRVDLSSDGEHLNIAGYKLVSRMAEQEIESTER